jgi:hypothetical protein
MREWRQKYIPESAIRTSKLAAGITTASSRKEGESKSEITLSVQSLEAVAIKKVKTIASSAQTTIATSFITVLQQPLWKCKTVQ